MNIPKYLVQVADKSLHGYWTLSVLLCDLTFNKEEVQVFELSGKSLTVCYQLVTIEQLRETAVLSVPKLCEGGNVLVGNYCEESKCQTCCPHDERDHGICLDCEHEEDPGIAIDRAMDSLGE